MNDDDEKNQEESLHLYKTQLHQVEQAIQAAGESEDLAQVKNDLQELITITEESLLEVKKKRLLASLEEVGQASTVSTQSSTDSWDEEYAAFKASLSGEFSTSSGPSLQSATESHLTATDCADTHLTVKSISWEGAGQLSSLVGTKCRAPFSHDWGGLHYGNAIILSVDTPSEHMALDDHQVQVMFVNPVTPSMVPCKYFMDGNCRFDSQDCRHCHGYWIPVSQIQPYLEPDHSKVCVGCRCLAKSWDSVWYPCVVTEICSDHMVMVRWETGKEEEGVAVEHILPIDNSNSSSDDDSDDCGEGTSDGRTKASAEDDDGDDGDENDNEEEEEATEVPVYLWRPLQTTERLGAWESHTKGIGSKLMAKMGYVTGQGLGRKGQGRAEPVPILLLPQGKSLDKIMQLKEMAGDQDLFMANRTLERRQKRLERKAQEQAKKKESKESIGVFGFLNQHLGAKATGDDHRQRRRHRHEEKTSTPKHVGIQDLGKRSDTEVNVQIFKTSEEMRSVTKHLAQLRKQLARNETRDRKMAQRVRDQIAKQESYLAQLQTSSQTLETHKAQRSAHKKLTIF